MLLVQHPKEARHAANTARMAHLGLRNSALFVGTAFAGHPGLARELAARRVALLFPGREAHNLSRAPAPPGPWSLLVIDGTWSQATKLLKLNPSWEELPRFSFDTPAPSAYQIRKEPKPEYLSTIESLTVALGLLEGRDFSKLLAPFHRMVGFQVAAIEREAKVRFRQRPRPATKPGLPERLRAVHERLVLVHTENNPGPRRKHDVVQLLASRPATGARFELFLEPHGRLGEATARYLELPAALLEAGRPRAELLPRWRAFAPERPIIASWGDHGVTSLADDGLPLAGRWDLRSLWAQHHGRKACGLETAAAWLGLAPTPWGHGRGGRRLGCLEALEAATRGR